MGLTAQPGEVSSAVPFEEVERHIESVFQTDRGIVVHLKDSQVLAPVDGDYAVFRTLTEYRQFSKDRTEWREILDVAEKRRAITAAPTLSNKMEQAVR